MESFIYGKEFNFVLPNGAWNIDLGYDHIKEGKSGVFTY